MPYANIRVLRDRIISHASRPVSRKDFSPNSWYSHLIFLETKDMIDYIRVSSKKISISLGCKIERKSSPHVAGFETLKSNVII